MVPQNPPLSGIDQHTINLLNQSEALLERSRQVAKAADAAADRLRRIVQRSDERAAVNRYRDYFNSATISAMPALFVA
jgi:hypothetical protein